MIVEVPCGFCMKPAHLVVAWRFEGDLAHRQDGNVYDFVWCPSCEQVQEARMCGWPWGGPGTAAEPCSEWNYHACVHLHKEEAHPEDEHRCACGATIDLSPEI